MHGIGSQSNKIELSQISQAFPKLIFPGNCHSKILCLQSKTNDSLTNKFRHSMSYPNSSEQSIKTPSRLCAQNHKTWWCCSIVYIILRACLVGCNRRCNVIVIFMVWLFFSLVMFLLQGIIIPYEQLFFKMRNNYSSLKGCIGYSLVSAIISKLNIFPNKYTFHINLTIKKIKNHKK